MGDFERPSRGKLRFGKDRGRYAGCVCFANGASSAIKKSNMRLDFGKLNTEIFIRRIRRYSRRCGRHRFPDGSVAVGAVRHGEELLARLVQDLLATGRSPRCRFLGATNAFLRSRSRLNLE